MPDLMPTSFLAVFGIALLLFVFVACWLARQIFLACKRLDEIFDQFEQNPFPIELIGGCSVCTKNQPGDKCEPNRND